MISSDYFDLQTNKKLHYLHAGKGKLKILLIHGGDRHYQNAEHWKEMIPWMTELGEVFAFDLLGHGKSVPDESFPEKTSAKEQIEALVSFARELKIKEKEAFLLWVGRSYGGYIVVSLLNKKPELVDAMVLIAPAIYPSQLEKVQKENAMKPVMLFWAEDDPIIPWNRHKQVLKTFSNLKLVEVGKVLKPDMERWKGHTPELIKKELFKKEFTDFINKILK